MSRSPEIVCGLIAAAVTSVGAVSVHRAEIWRPHFEEIAKMAEVGPVGSIFVLPGKGCGWSFGETIWVDVQFGERAGVVKLCMSRDGDRWIDITTTLSGPLKGEEM